MATAFHPPRAYFGYAHLGTLQSGSIAGTPPSCESMYNDVGLRRNSQRCGEEDRVMEDRTGLVAGVNEGAMIGLGLGHMAEPGGGQRMGDELEEKARAGTRVQK